MDDNDLDPDALLAAVIEAVADELPNRADQRSDLSAGTIEAACFG
jgi:hypothetical protein